MSPLCGHALPDLLAGAMVVRLGGADEAVVRDVERSSISWNRSALRVASSGRQLLGFGGLLHLQAVLVGAGEEEHVLAVEPLEARDRVGGDRLVGVADVRHAVGIGDRGRDVERVRLAAGADGFATRERLRRAWRGSCGALRGLPAASSARFLPTCRRLALLLCSFSRFCGFAAFFDDSWRPSSQLRPSSGRLASWPRAFFARLLAVRGRRRLAAFFALRFFDSFLAAVATTNSFMLNDCRNDRRRSATASLPRASRTPRKPAVFAPDCRIRCRARRG